MSEDDHPEYFRSKEAYKLWLQLQGKLDSSENCYNPLDPNVADRYTEAWTGRAIPPEVAQELCEGCHVIELCAQYARANHEKYGVWGGESPQMRGVSRKFRAW